MSFMATNIGDTRHIDNRDDDNRNKRGDNTDSNRGSKRADSHTGSRHSRKSRSGSWVLELT
jgi:hypothetical protein